MGTVIYNVKIIYIGSSFNMLMSSLPDAYRRNNCMLRVLHTFIVLTLPPLMLLLFTFNKCCRNMLMNKSAHHLKVRTFRPGRHIIVLVFDKMTAQSYFRSNSIVYEVIGEPAFGNIVDITGYW